MGSAATRGAANWEMSGPVAVLAFALYSLLITAIVVPSAWARMDQEQAQARAELLAVQQAAEAAAASAAAAEQRRADAIRAEGAAQGWPVVEVKAGENAFQIASRVGVPPEHVVVANIRYWPDISKSIPRPAGSLLVIPHYDFGYSWVNQVVEPASAVTAGVAVGSRVRVVLRLRNTSTMKWIRDTSTELLIGWPSGDEVASWRDPSWLGANRYARQTEPVIAPGEAATFDFSVTVSARGSYRLPIRPVHEGVSWLDDLGLYVQVRGR